MQRSLTKRLIYWGRFMALAWLIKLNNINGTQIIGGRAKETLMSREETLFLRNVMKRNGCDKLYW